MAKQSKETVDLLYNCPKAGIEVHLSVEGEFTQGFFGKKFKSQEVVKCDLLSQGGCTIKIDPAVSSKCPAVMKALKCALK